MANKANHRSFGSIRDRSRSGAKAKRWQARYVGPDSDSHARVFGAKIDAEEWLAAERRLIDARTWAPPKIREAEAAAERERLEAEAEAAAQIEANRRANTFGTYADAWVAGRTTLQPTSRRTYEHLVRVHLAPGLGHIPLHELTADDVRAWLATYERRSARNADGSVKTRSRANAYALGKTIMAQAVDDELARRNPFRERGAARAKNRREPQALSLAELMALAHAMPARHYAATLVAGTCTLRRGELMALRRRDLNLADGTITIAGTVIRTEGEWTWRPHGKSRAALRTIAVPKFVLDALREHLDAYTAHHPNAPVFPGPNGGWAAEHYLYGKPPRPKTRTRADGTPVTYHQKGHGFHGARHAIGRPGLVWHDLRRTAATLALASGGDLRTVQARMGHETPTMTMHYAQSSTAVDRALAESIDQLHANLAVIDPEMPADASATTEAAVIPLHRTSS